MRERECFRDNLELIRTAEPGKAMFNISEVARITGLSRKKVRGAFVFGDNRLISINDLARQMSARKTANT